MIEDYGLDGVPKKARVPIAKAQKVADLVREWLDPISATTILVGSMRRGRPRVGDVEFVVLPKDLDRFHKAVTSLGFRTGEKKRKYTLTWEGLKVELYVAHKPEELGALMLTYTGDLLFNINLRNQAKRMGYKLNQYGILKGRQYAFQSPDEREFFDFLGMEYHTPEERSLMRRDELRDAVKKLLASTPKASDRKLLEKAREQLKSREPLPVDLEDRIVALAEKSGMSLGSVEMGFQPVPDEDVQDAREIIQAMYDQQVGRGGTVIFMDVNIAYNVAQVIAAVHECGDEMIYLLQEMTDLPEEALDEIAINPTMFLKDLVEAAGRGEVHFAWQGPFRPMVE